MLTLLFGRKNRLKNEYREKKRCIKMGESSLRCREEKRTGKCEGAE